eukprot:COSAG01_NODE_93_length_27013_cov_41.515791_17_plen_504_part_01
MPTEKRWQLLPQQQELSQKIASHLNIKPVIAQLLLNRGILSLSQAQFFLKPDQVPQNPNDSFASADLKACADLLHTAISNKTPILLYGDYDVDGMTSVSLMMLALQELGADVRYYIPDRFKEGYGLNMNIVPAIKAQNIGLLITLDCGVSSVKEITAIKNESACKVMVLDHHQLPKPMAPSDAMLNPCTLDAKHPAAGLCTVGVAYAFVKYYFQRHQASFDPDCFLDLVALGTVADVASLHGLNRTWTVKGLKLLSQRKRLGIDALLTAAKFKHKYVSARDLGFVLGPRLNAAGRLETASMGVRLLTATNKAEAEQLAFQLETLNLNRRDIGNKMVEHACALQDQEAAKGAVTVLANPEWHPGVIGITASRLVERYGQPAIMISGEGDVARGSARTSGDVNLYALLKSCKSHFSTFGGHKQAAGFSLPWEAVPALKTALLEASNKLDPLSLRPILAIDSNLSPQDLTLELAELLQQLEPFGVGNQAPVFFCNELKVMAVRPVGN